MTDPQRDEGSGADLPEVNSADADPPADVRLSAGAVEPETTRPGELQLVGNTVPLPPRSFPRRRWTAEERANEVWFERSRELHEAIARRATISCWILAIALLIAAWFA